MEEAAYADFAKLDMRAGRITRAEDFPAARKPAYRLWIDFGALGVRQSSAQITRLYQKEDLVGRLVLAVVNLPPKRVAGFTSEVLVLGTLRAEGEVVLIQPDRDVPLGARLF